MHFTGPTLSRLSCCPCS